MGKMFRIEKRGELTPAGGIGSNLPWVGMSSLPPSVTGGKLLRRRNYRSVGMSFSERANLLKKLLLFQRGRWARLATVSTT